MRVLILASPQVDATELRSDDRDVPGTYAVDLKDDVADVDVASAALDGFHSNVPVKMLDDFSFSVHDRETGRVLVESEEREDYALSKKCVAVEKVRDDLDELCVRSLNAGSLGPNL